MYIVHWAAVLTPSNRVPFPGLSNAREFGCRLNSNYAGTNAITSSGHCVCVCVRGSTELIIPYIDIHYTFLYVCIYVYTHGYLQ